MATVRAIQKYVRQTPRKLRAVADLVRGRELPEINEILTNLNKRGARVINETIRQAVANAVNNMGYNETQLSLKSLMINEGPTYKRFRAGSRGRAKPYEKKTSHVLVELHVEEAAAPKAAAKPAKAEKAAEASASDAPAAEKAETKTAEKKAVKKSSKSSEKAAAKKETTKKSTTKKTAAKKAETKSPAKKKTTAKKSSKKDTKKTE
ncbi:50S ribosomal protein L22 [Candidatus Woesebacteria bacterium]|nr:50S ribosomal protein L22 [Candidatus Woesebacteria bacterium]MCD8526774.1 50S ribosomal protein L22 [Candidatus Woesebacteria bacterium]MCD8546480.1 50S ribosomal protein L22 [Candidatus Woesebacteria bacterium]